MKSDSPSGRAMTSTSFGSSTPPGLTMWMPPSGSTSKYDPVLHEQLQRQLKVELEGNPAAWRRTAQAQSLWSLGLFISAGLAQGQSLESLLAPFLRTIRRA